MNGKNLTSTFSVGLRVGARLAISLLLLIGLVQLALAHGGNNPLKEGAPHGSGFAQGTISIPDPKQQAYLQSGVLTTVPEALNRLDFAHRTGQTFRNRMLRGARRNSPYCQSFYFTVGHTPRANLLRIEENT